MKTAVEAMNPFMLMMEPQRVFETMEHSQQLRTLHRRQLRPLDRPLIPYVTADAASRIHFDADIDAEPFDDEGDGWLN